MSDHSPYQSPAQKGSHTVWFPETCAFFFNGEHRRKFDEVMAGLIRRRIVTCTDGKLFTQVAA
jgi:hypothetical protein